MADTIFQKKADNAAMLDDLAQARRVIDEEAAALSQMGATLDERFIKAVSLIDGLRRGTDKPPGRLIVAGIGKSGHIARKIAATMASTGTPAFFVHPGEASHGDLGMITEKDAVLLLSNSGESAELSDLIHFTRRFDIPLIAMTGNAESTLARHAAIVLQVPDVKEACPNGLAPTTSTTMMLALGDALAVALLARSGLTAEQFKAFHPGGKLGQKLLSVADLMHPFENLPLVAADTKMDEALISLTEKNMGCVIAIDEAQQKTLGILTDGDLKRHMAPDLLQKKVADVMTRDPKAITSNMLAAEALHIMTREQGRYLTSLLVNDEKGRLIGLLRLQDCLQAGVA